MRQIFFILQATRVQAQFQTMPLSKSHWDNEGRRNYVILMSSIGDRTKHSQNAVAAASHCPIFTSTIGDGPFKHLLNFPVSEIGPNVLKLLSFSPISLSNSDSDNMMGGLVPHLLDRSLHNALFK
jgi:hypothetical protein